MSIENLKHKKSAQALWPRTERRRATQYDKKKEAILQTSAMLFKTNGYDQVSINDVADYLKITKPTIYYYLGNKDLILLEIKRLVQTETLRVLREAKAMECSGYEKLQFLIPEYVKILATDFGGCFVRTMHVRMAKESQEEVVSRSVEGNRIMNDIIVDGQNDGSLAVEQPAVTTLTLLGALNWTAYWYEPGRSISLEELGRSQAHILLNGISGKAR